MALSKEDMLLPAGAWWQAYLVQRESYVCGFCGSLVGSDKGYQAGPNPDGGGPPMAYIRICPSCDGPTVFTHTGKRSPSNAPGNPVNHVPEELSQLYNEARSSAGAGAPTAAVLACRKMLMNIAVAKGAKENRPFAEYVKYLADKGYVPPDGEVWVDYIRKRGNEANHEIRLMAEPDAIALIGFVEMLLRFIYEFPRMVPAEEVAPETGAPMPPPP